ncbi:MAG: sialate O-acetylesterase [Planctomycetes bacterium]|nr:sialate O-acetylesterase [Planctomycetota bacterium]
MKLVQKIILAASLILITSVAIADIKLPAVIADNMVLQQKSNAPIWGWADPGEKIAVSTSWKKSAKTTTGKDGKWKLKLRTPKAGGPYDITITGNNTIKLQNILVGEVWICSGQSNMEYSMAATENAAKDIPAANKPNIRLFKVTRTIADQPKDDCSANWSQCSPETVAQFSAVAYFFGKHLQDELDIPIGLISTNWGGSVAEAWTRKEILESDADFAPILKRQEEMEANFPEAMKKYPQVLEAWKAKAEEAKAEGKKKPRRPRKPVKRKKNSPSSLYNGMIAPIIPYAIKGAIWYQGESNVSRAYQYRKLFPAMITNWRKDWKQGDFPFYYVQIAPYKYDEKNPSQELREAQRLTVSLKNTGMAVTMDIGNPRDIHPKNKLDVGKRLALWALAKNYGKKGTVYSGPLYKSMKKQGDKIRLYFNHTGSGLTTRDGNELTHFTIAAEDKNFVDAKAVIDGKTIIVSSEEIKKPVAVRYAWSNAAQPNLANKEKLPASSFRTDNWPEKTFNKK